MKFDISEILSTLDNLHLGLIAIVFILMILLVMVLSIAMIGLLRKPAVESDDVAVDFAGNKLPVRDERRSSSANAAGIPLESTILKETSPDAALQLLGLLQQEARFIDFLEEDVSAYNDAEIGAAARVVHDGCHKVLHKHFDFAPIRKEEENSKITLPKGFDSSAIRLTGNIVGQAPFKGTLVHRGWRATNIKLPKVADGHDVRIMASAEIEL